MSDVKPEYPVHVKPDVADPKATKAAEAPEQLFAVHDLSKPDAPCICLVPTAEEAKKKSPKSKVVDVDPALWKPKKKTTFVPADPEYAMLAWAIDNRGK